MSKIARLFIATVICVGLFAAAPANALFPEGWSLAFQDVTGGIVECIDFVACSQSKCPAVAFAAGKQGQYDNVTGDFESGRTRTTANFNNINWFAAFSVAPTKKVILDVTCSRLGFGLWTFGGLSGAPASCGAEATIRAFGGSGTNFNESFSAVTLDAGVTCDDFFGAGPEAMRSNQPQLRSRIR